MLPLRYGIHLGDLYMFVVLTGLAALAHAMQMLFLTCVLLVVYTTILAPFVNRLK